MTASGRGCGESITESLSLSREETATGEGLLPAGSVGVSVTANYNSTPGKLFFYALTGKGYHTKSNQGVPQKQHAPNQPRRGIRREPKQEKV